MDVLSDSSERKRRNRSSCEQGQYTGKLVLFIFLGKLSLLPTLPRSLPDPRNLNWRRSVEASTRQCKKIILIAHTTGLFIYLESCKYEKATSPYGQNAVDVIWKCLLIEQFKQPLFTCWSSFPAQSMPHFCYSYCTYPHFQTEWKKISLAICPAGQIQVILSQRRGGIHFSVSEEWIYL